MESEITIRSGRDETGYWRDLWRYRELFVFLAWRDIIVRYKQTVAGSTWALIRPLLTIIVFTVIFGRMGKFPSDGVPYPILVLAGMLPWQFFSNAISSATHSLVNNNTLISKIYFPRLIIPISTFGVAIIDYLITLGILAAMMAWYNVMPTWRLLCLPAFTLLAVAAALGPGLLISALMVEYRDFKHIVPFFVQFGTYVSPVGFSTSVVPEQWRMLYACNPVVGVIEGFRWCIYGGQTGDGDKNSILSTEELLISCGIVLILLVLGVWYFRRTEKTFADLI
jgi:lipopolysaccharide transport system permease protein